jgi:uncharacterized membrane protein YtjA (UPF0391 family)
MRDSFLEELGAHGSGIAAERHWGVTRSAPSSRREPDGQGLSIIAGPAGARPEPQIQVRSVNPQKNNPMLSWILTFLVLAIVAGALGFTGIAGASIAIAQTLFYIFLILFVVSLIVHIARGSGSKTDL